MAHGDGIPVSVGVSGAVLGAVLSQCGVRPVCLEVLILCTSDILLVTLGNENIST